jgi:DnaJ-class molecular chaperone
MKRYLFETKVLLAEEKYDDALVNLRKMFSLKITLPDELAYYLGYTYIKQKNYVKGKEALDKYLELQGSSAQFYKESLALLKDADDNTCKRCLNTGWYEKIENCLVCDKSGKNYKDCMTCKGSGRAFCKSCKGSGVLKNKDAMGGGLYATCTRCEGRGATVCYVCDGAKTISSLCRSCNGTGETKARKPCDHQH